MIKVFFWCVTHLNIIRLPTWRHILSQNLEIASSRFAFLPAMQEHDIDRVHGHCDPRFSSLRNLLQDNLSRGEELGASLCVNVDGNTLVDLWGGYTTEARTEVWSEDTITCVWSSSKCITNLAALILVEKGLLDLHEKVSTYWPQFAANGKEDTEIRHLLSHTSGVSGWEQPITFDEICDVESATARLATQSPWWKAGTASGYHAISQGHLLGEVIRRITGKTLSQFVADEICSPLNVDFQYGCREEDEYRAAEIIPVPNPFPPDVDRASVAGKTGLGSPIEATYANSPTLRKSALGASNGFSNARALARAMSILSLGGEVDGHRYLSPQVAERAVEEQIDGVELVFGNRAKWTMGYALATTDPQFNWIPQGRVCFWGGWGGSICIMDLDRRMTITYVMNKMDNCLVGSDRTRAYVRAIYNAWEEGGPKL